jgi:hypothetical protein
MRASMLSPEQASVVRAFVRGLREPELQDD